MSPKYFAVVIALGCLAVANSDSIQNTRTVVGKCPAVDPATPIYLTDSNSCSIFYECSNGVPIKLSCPAGLHFNPSIHVCDYPDHAGCRINTARIVMGKCPPIDYGYPTYIPDSDSCSIFYECSNGVPIKLSCPAGLHFNPSINVCDFPDHAGCHIGGK